jgi:acyl-coenzyme A thioesterase PaaI-like protein
MNRFQTLLSISTCAATPGRAERRGAQRDGAAAAAAMAVADAAGAAAVHDQLPGRVVHVDPRLTLG